jgi:hypothetical protein
MGSVYRNTGLALVTPAKEGRLRRAQTKTNLLVCATKEAP